MPDRKTILTVDDSANSLAPLRSVLETTCQVCLAKSADIALVILKAIPVDMILLDMEMPGNAGPAFLSLLRNSPDFRHIPVISVVSPALPAINCAGADAVVTRPVAGGVLLDKVNALLNAVP